MLLSSSELAFSTNHRALARIISARHVATAKTNTATSFLFLSIKLVDFLKKYYITYQYCN